MNKELERAIERVAARTGLLPSVVRHCLTAYADDPELLAAAWDEGQYAWEGELLGRGPGVNPYRKGGPND